ncbi:hypothetical protein ALC62_12709 [Cyphomyrmex costatus]|uniref:Uncharacterized protein n=1 Tax=Cyphomyrmex costatus TaxID=456900 RepID=A0A195C745_9HYME|nr:hypothetical protein ALC62_12709 [Cyphomyrmex costatus]
MIHHCTIFLSLVIIIMLIQNLYIFVVEESTKTIATSEVTNTEQAKMQINGDITVTCINLSLSEVVSLLGLADDDEVLAGTSEESRKRALWQFYSTGMLTHSHSDGEFPIYSQDAHENERNLTSRTGRPISIRKPEMIEKVRDFVANDRNALLKMMEEILNINRETIRTILHEDLSKTKVCAKFVPHILKHYLTHCSSIFGPKSSLCAQSSAIFT